MHWDGHVRVEETGVKGEVSFHSIPSLAPSCPHFCLAQWDLLGHEMHGLCPVRAWTWDGFIRISGRHQES